MIFRVPKYYSPADDERSSMYMFVHVCVHSSRTKAMNTGCGINSNDRLNALEIGVIRRKGRIRCIDRAREPDPKTCIEYPNIFRHNRISKTVSVRENCEEPTIIYVLAIKSRAAVFDRNVGINVKKRKFNDP